jgi:prophage regulatory protein
LNAEPVIARLVRLPEVLRRTGLSRSEVYRRVAIGSFPKPLKLGIHASAFVDAEVTAWVAARIEARDSGEGA